MRPCFTFIVVLPGLAHALTKEQEQQCNSSNTNSSIKVEKERVVPNVIDFVTIIYYQSFQFHMCRIAKERVTLTYHLRLLSTVNSFMLA